MLPFVRMMACAALAVAGPMLAAAADTYVHTPMGRMRSDCVHRVPSGAHAVEDSVSGRLHLHDAEGTFLRAIPRCEEQATRPLFERDLLARRAAEAAAASHLPRIVLQEDVPTAPRRRGRHLLQDFPPDYDGWEAYTMWQSTGAPGSPGDIAAFLGNFSVPDAPKSMPDILFIFTGLQNVDWIPKVDPLVPGFDIIQPVLQYPADSGEGWSVKSWYVTEDDGALQTDEVVLRVGDTVFGNMTRLSPPGASTGKWLIDSVSTQTGKHTALTVERPRLAQQLFAYNTLECYGCQDCSTYPQQPCRFSELLLLGPAGQKLSPQWKLNPKPNPQLWCAETIEVYSPSKQDIVFQKP